MPPFNLKIKESAPRYATEAKREYPASEFIPYACHYDPNTILTKSGSLLQVLKIEGLAFETADDDYLSFRKTLRNTMFRSIPNSRYGLYVHTVRRKQSNYPEGKFPQGFSHQLNEAWKRKHSGLKLFVNDFYLTIIQKPKASGAAGVKDWWDSLSHGKGKVRQNENLREGHQEILAISNRFLTNLKDYGARLLGTVFSDGGIRAEIAEFFSLLINLESLPVQLP